MQEKGIVMEINGPRMVVLTEDGCFVSQKIPSPCPRIGEEVFVKKGHGSKTFWFYTGLVSIAAMLVAVFFAGSLWNSTWSFVPSTGNAVSFITVDINPSVELGLNTRGIVVSAEGLNEDGKQVLKGLQVIGKPSDTVVASIVDVAAEYGYLAPEKDNEIVINVSGECSDFSGVSDQTMEKITNVLDKRSLNVQVNYLNTDLELRREANKIGLSAGKYAVLLEAQKEGFDVELQDIKELGIRKAINAAGGNPQKILKKAREEEDFSKEINKWKTKIKKLQRENHSNGNDSPSPQSGNNGKQKTGWKKINDIPGYLKLFNNRGNNLDFPSEVKGKEKLDKSRGKSSQSESKKQNFSGKKWE